MREHLDRAAELLEQADDEVHALIEDGVELDTQGRLLYATLLATLAAQRIALANAVHELNRPLTEDQVTRMVQEHARKDARRRAEEA
jgi:hypothetical protein